MILTISPAPVSPLRERVLPFHQTRPLVCWALCYGAGVLAGAGVSFGWLWLIGLGCACVFALVCSLGRHGTPLAFFPAFFFLGLVLASLSASPFRPAEGNYAFTGTVDGRVRYREDGQVACVLKNVTAGGSKLSGGLYWSFYVKEGEATPALENGDSVSFSGRLYHPSGQENPYGFDFDLYLKQRGICAGIYGQEELSVTPAQSVWDGSMAYRLRTDLSQALYKTMGDKATLAVVMLLGSQDALPDEALKDFRVTGTAHILSISGLHVAYLAGMLIWLLKKLRLGSKPRFFIVAAFLIAYSWLVGMSPPVIRSALMLLFYLGAKPLGLPHDPLTSIAAAFLLLLIAHPLDLLSASFQLSFGAVMGMLLIGDPLLKWQDRRFPEKKPPHRRGRFRQYLHKQWRSLKTLPALGLSAQLGIALPLASWYQQVTLLGLVVNLVVIPYVAVLMLVYIAALAASPLGCIGICLGTVAGFMTDVLLFIVHVGADIPGMSLRVASPAWPVILGSTACLILLSQYVVWRGRKRIGLMVLSAVLAVGGTLALYDPAVRYIQFSMGDADAAVLVDGNYTAVVDTGETGSDLAAYLRATNRPIEALILTHLHTDHAGGVAKLLEEEIPIRKAYIAEGAETALADPQGILQLQALRAAGVPIETLKAGDTLQSPRTTFKVLWPQEGKVRPNQEANDSSLVFYLKMEGVSLLNMGDLSGTYEKYAQTPADILKAAHHGSKSSTGTDFLKVVLPSLALISCAGQGSLPSSDTLDRLSGLQIPCLRTDQSGAITLRVNADQWKTIPFRKEKP